MVSLKFPENSKNPIECADWMELKALLSAEHRCSIAEVERSLKRLSAYDADRTIQQNAKVETACAEVLGELQRRTIAADTAYPFTLVGTEIVLSGTPEGYAPYIFCLCLSWFGWKQRKGNKVFPRRMFEDLAKYAAQTFVSGQALRFGSPRIELSRSFKEALLQLCIAIGEGQVSPVTGRTNAQDDTLDLIAWKDFPDRSEGKLFLVGQCASGDDWEGKKRELDVDAFFDNWFSERPPSLRSMRTGLFIPHRVPKSKWKSVTRHAGIIFDRCRIAYLSQTNLSFTNRTSYSDWSAATLAQVRSK